jgi:preprotein translocase subunit SecG
MEQVTIPYFSRIMVMIIIIVIIIVIIIIIIMVCRNTRWESGQTIGSFRHHVYVYI